MKSEISNIKSQRAFMREYFYNFVEGTSNQICDYLISQGVKFRVTELKDKRKSVSGSLSKLYKDKEMLEQVLKIMENISQGWFTAMEASNLETGISKRLEYYEDHLYYELANVDIME
jgi:hypothetical protein